MRCERCNKEVEETPFNDGICETCVNELIMPQAKSFDWSHWNFEKADYKKR